MSIRRVAIVFDSTERPETTGVYCRRGLSELVALGELDEVRHYLPTEFRSLAKREFDLYVLIDDGLRYQLPEGLGPTAYWAIDTHVDLAWSVERARRCNLVFAAQKNGAEWLRLTGVEQARWLPLACDPDLHRPHAVPKQWDWAFIGNMFPGRRQEVIERLARRFDKHFVGQLYFDALARGWSAAKVGVNASLVDDVNMRVFEVLGCGTMLLTNDVGEIGQAELFEDGVHLVTYQTVEDAEEKLAYYLEHEEERARIAAAGRALVVAQHTYLHRMREILAAANEFAASSVSTMKSERKPTAAAVRPAERLAPAQDDRPDQHDVQAPAARAEAAAAEIGARAPGGLVAPTEVPYDPGYFEFDRPELLALVPVAARHVLEIGCGAGRAGEALRARQGCRVVGVEVNAEAAAQARRRLDEVHVGDAEALPLPFQPGEFDCLLAGDVLEHMRDPEAFLNRSRDWLGDRGCLVVSIPNVRNHTLISSLLGGNWTYESAGLLDRTHLRFFTRREIEKMLYRAGYAIDRLQFMPGPGHQEWLAAGRPPYVDIAGRRVNGFTPDDAEEFFAYQFLVLAHKASRPDRGLTSVVLVTFNQLEFTRQCLDSIRTATREPHELIVVDNGSTDGSVAWLEHQADVRLIKNHENRGFPAAANQGLRAARGEQIVLLNNDTLVTTGWLDRLLAALHANPAIGLAGPVSNCVSGPQQIDVPYTSLANLDGFGWEHGREHAQERQDVERLVGFCLAIRRKVVDKIGYLDEQFGIGNFEDDDYCRRALEAGFRAVIARDSFVHHFGQVTFRAEKVDYARLLGENRRKFERKWAAAAAPGASTPLGTGPATRPNGAGTATASPRAAGASPTGGTASMPPTARAARAAPRFSISKGPGRGLRLASAGPLISLCMIVRDNARTIEAALNSIRPWVDEMIVVDTGSVDGTREICQRLGAKVFDFAWCDDFSAARNESVKHATGDWIFWMDSDDEIDTANGEALRSLAHRERNGSVMAFAVQVHCPGDDGDFTQVDHVKLFRNRKGIVFENRIHEQVLPSIRAAGGEVVLTDLFVAHAGSDRSEAGQARKRKRDLRLLRLELREKPDHPYVLFNLGMTLADAGKYRRAARWLRGSISQSNGGESTLRKAYALLAVCEFELKNLDAARDVLREGRQRFPRDPELLFREGILLHELGDARGAVVSYRGALADNDQPHFGSMVRGILGHKTRQNLALALTDLGELSAAEIEWRQIIAEVPNYRDGWIGLFDNLLARKKLAEAEQVTQQAALIPELGAVPAVLGSGLAAARHEIPLAMERACRAVENWPHDRDAWQRYCQLMFHYAPEEQARDALEEMVRRFPDDASAYQNLGTMYQRLEMKQQAAEALRQSLRLREDSAGVRDQLAAIESELADAGSARAGASAGGPVEMPRHRDFHGG